MFAFITKDKAFHESAQKKVGAELEKCFDGKASNLVDSCGKSAAKLVELVARHFPGTVSECIFFSVVHSNVLNCSFFFFFPW